MLIRTPQSIAAHRTGVRYAISAIPALFPGTGRVALMGLAVNNTAFSNFGDGAAVTRFGRRAGPPHYVTLRELTTNVWLGTDIPSSAEGSAGVPFVSARSIYKPMKRLRYDAAGVSDGSGGAVDYPQTSSTQWIEFNVGSLEAQATRLGVIIGFSGDNCGIAKVEVTEAVAGTVVPNLLPTAQQAYARGQISQATRDKIGASVYVLGTSSLDVQRFGAFRHQHIPVADDLPPGSYKIRLTFTGEKGRQLNGATAVDRMYVAYATYAASDLAHDDAGAELYAMNWLGSARDGSTSETHTLGGRVTGSGNPSVILGGGHGGEKLSANPVLTVDGQPVEIYARTATRARASNVATLTFDRPHRRLTGDVVTISGVSGTGYNAEGVAVTVIDATTFTYTNSGSNEASTADTGGRFIAHGLVIGSTIGIGLTTNFYHPNYGGGALVVATGAITYTQAQAFADSHSITLAVNYDIDTSTYLALTTSFTGSRANFGPEYGGPVTFKRAGTPDAGALLTADNNSEGLEGGTSGYCAFGSETGVASAFLVDALSPGIGKAFVQDRTGGGVEKAYFRVYAALTAQTSGAVFTASTRRYDGILSAGGNYPALR